MDADIFIYSLCGKCALLCFVRLAIREDFFKMQQPPTDFDLFRSFLGGNRGRKMSYSSPDLSSETFF